jgi:hypothetical protein
MALATLGSFAIRSWTASNRAAALGVGTLRGLLTVVPWPPSPSTEMARQVLAAPPQI